MTINQISLFMENRAGPMVRITDLLSERKLTLRAVSIAETRDYGILRLRSSEGAGVFSPPPARPANQHTIAQASARVRRIPPCYRHSPRYRP